MKFLFALLASVRLVAPNTVNSVLHGSKKIILVIYAASCTIAGQYNQ